MTKFTLPSCTWSVPSLKVHEASKPLINSSLINYLADENDVYRNADDWASEYNVRNAADVEAVDTYIDENDVYQKADVRAF